MSSENLINLGTPGRLGAVMAGRTLEEVAATMGDTIETVRENYLLFPRSI